MASVGADIVHSTNSIPVQFACSCGQLRPIFRIYFCRYCLKLRCSFCVCHEIDSIYCPNCCENMPSQEARLKRNKCSSCFDCPVCDHTLSTRATQAPQRNPEEKAVKKVYYLGCLSCRWTSREIGIPDQTTSSGNWPERENVHTNRIIAIQERYRNVVLWEKFRKQDKQRRKFNPRGKYITLTDKTGITAAIARQRVGLPEMPTIMPTVKEVEPAVAKEEVEQLPEDIFTKIVNLNEITTLSQRLNQPEWQPVTVDKMFLVHKSLMAKRSQRCRTCEHNVSKPEYNPNSTKYKINLLACYHVPDVRLFTVEPLRAGKKCDMILKFINPTQYPITVTFLPLPSEEEEAVEIEEQIRQTLNSLEIRDEPRSLPREGNILTSLPKQISLPEEPRPVSLKTNAGIVLPEASITLAPKDDAAEYGDSGEIQSYQDDPNIVLWRKFNKVTIKMQIVPDENLEIGADVIVGFTMQHTYMNTVTTENKEPKKIDHNAKVFIKVGNLVGSD